MPRLLLVAAAAMTCVPAAAQSPYPHRSAEEAFDCRESGLAQFVGKTPTQETAVALMTASGAKKLRWVAHGSAVDADKRGDRVTVQLDAQGRIEWARCL